MNNKAQVTIFIIAAIVIVAGVVLIFAFRGEILPDTFVNQGVSKDPEQFISQCVREKVGELENEIIAHGGFIETPEALKMDFRHKQISYLCFTPFVYSRCFPVESLLISHLEGEIYDNLDATIDECFLELETNLNDDAYATLLSPGKDFSVELLPGRIKVEITKELETSKADQNKNYKNFLVSAPSNIFGMAELVQRIIEEESKYCNSDYIKMMAGNTWADISRFQTGDENKIYTLKDLNTQKEWTFAIKGCLKQRLS